MKNIVSIIMIGMLLFNSGPSSVVVSRPDFVSVDLLAEPLCANIGETDLGL
ncbi:hypothetical protein Hgul01_04081 [Herpetosiphon gulosus]|uniref:Uncharacterized protein n=1 Tax=Herpetosiphon gulosus TaxID=1973496 RepID=A0ABP9X5X8_9CHLR